MLFEAIHRLCGSLKVAFIAHYILTGNRGWMQMITGYYTLNEIPVGCLNDNNTTGVDKLPY
jgi:hypothetical protein